MKKIYVYVKEVNDGYEVEGIVASINKNPAIDNKDNLAHIADGNAIVKAALDKGQKLTLGWGTNVTTDAVVITSSKRTNGHIYAHEYDEYVPATMTVRQYSNGYIENIAKVKKGYVGQELSGVWEYFNGDGMGNTFE